MQIKSCKADVVILTALPIESKAVRAHLMHLYEEVNSIGTVYCVGTFLCGNSNLKVAVAEVGLHNVQSAIEAERAIDFFNPKLMLFIGIAGGIKDVKIGDVVAATKIYWYESAKIGPYIMPRPELYISSHALEQRARAEASKKDWLKRLKNPILKYEPRVFVGPIASGEKVLVTTEAGIYKEIRDLYSDALAIEMEGFGFLKVISDHKEIYALVVRGISDLLVKKNTRNEIKRQEKAAERASAFAFEVLSKILGNIENTACNFKNSSLDRPLKCRPSELLEFYQYYPQQSKNLKVLLIEDNPYDALFTKRNLKFNKLDRDFSLAVSGAEAKDTLEDMANKGQLPGLILLDLYLPDIFGIDLLKWLKKDDRFNSIPVVILTFSIDDNNIQKCYDLGASTYLVKPISSEALMVALENINLF